MERKSNTDNIDKLFPAFFRKKRDDLSRETGSCHSFCFAPAPKTNPKRFLHQDTRICKQFKSCTVTVFLPRLRRGNWTLPRCYVGQHKRPILPDRYAKLET